MSIKQHLEGALRNIQAEKERSVANAKEMATRDIIIPHNATVDKAMNEAITEITAQFNAQLSQLQSDFAAQKQALSEEGTRKKNEFANAALAEATATVEAKYSAIVTTLEAKIAETED